MIELIPEPKIDQPVTEEWQKMIKKLTETTGGLLLAQLTNTHNTNEPELAVGSRFEVNKSFYHTLQDEPIDFGVSPVSGKLFIYATPRSDGTCSLNYLTTMPELDLAKGGYYFEEKRCIASVTYDATRGIFFDKHIVDVNSDTPLFPKYPVGSFIQQLPDELSPAGRGLPGLWSDWSMRPVMYGLALTPPPSGFETDYEEHGASIWHLNTDGTVATLGTKKYTKPDVYISDSRQECGNDLQEDDWEIGHEIHGGRYSGMFVWETVTLGGLFLSVHDGGRSRPPFNSGTHSDAIRDITGGWDEDYSSGGYSPWGAFARYQYRQSRNQTGVINNYVGLTFAASRDVPTSNQNSPVTASCIIWRRIF